MKKIVENNVLRKIIIIPVIVFILLTFAMPTVSRADGDDTTQRNFVDWIINIITSIPIWLCDVANQIIKAGVTLDASKLIDGTVFTGEDEIKEWIEEGNGHEDSLNTREVSMGKDIDQYAVLKLSISPAEIFANKIALLDANYFSTNNQKLQ